MGQQVTWPLSQEEGGVDYGPGLLSSFFLCVHPGLQLVKLASQNALESMSVSFCYPKDVIDCVKVIIYPECFGIHQWSDLGLRFYCASFGILMCVCACWWLHMCTVVCGKSLYTEACFSARQVGFFINYLRMSYNAFDHIHPWALPSTPSRNSLSSLFPQNVVIPFPP